MKFYIAILLLALAAVALADKPADEESIKPINSEVENNAARDKRGLLYRAAYTAPIAYTAPVAYADSLPYVYSSYRTYPYYSPLYSASYVVA